MATTPTRRTVVAAGAAAGALLLTRPVRALAAPLGPEAAFDTSRASRLFPGARLAHADLHNHTLFSDGNGMAADAYESMRTNGLDIAALTDHSSFNKLIPQDVCSPLPAGRDACGAVGGIDEVDWTKTGQLADAADRPDTFTAIRGFEWSSPTLGHMNVWFSKTWTDPLATGGANPADGAARFAHEFGPDPTDPLFVQLDALVRARGQNSPSMAGFHEWLRANPDRPLIGGGNDAIAGFNHPGREFGRFGNFTFDPAIAPRVVTIEMFNRGEDYLFEGTDSQGTSSPLTQCLDAGWRVGIAGVTDEHGTNWGQPDGKGRSGIWVDTLTRGGTRAGLEARRVFATRLRGLRVDASANGARMGSTLVHTKGPVEFALDISRGSMWVGRPLRVQVLQTGFPLPSVVHTEDVVVASDTEPVIRFSAPIDAANGRWVVLRITDPAAAADKRAPAGEYKTAGEAVAYASPFFLRDAPDAVIPEVSAPIALPLAATALAGGLLALRRRRDLAHAHDHDHDHGVPA